MLSSFVTHPTLKNKFAGFDGLFDVVDIGFHFPPVRINPLIE
jgi:hypothetical protein